MTTIINLINFNNENFKNKKSKYKMKNFIKKNLNDFDINKDEIINKYLNPIQNICLDLKLKKINDEYNLILFKEMNEEKSNKQFKSTLRNKIKMSRDSNYEITHYNDSISEEINYSYYLLKNNYHYNFNHIPSPNEILNNRDKYIDLLFQSIVSTCEKIKTDDKSVLYSIIDSNDYLNYIQKVCNINYKDYVSDLFRKINELSDENSNVPKIIASEIDNKIDINELSENIQNMLIDDNEIDEISIKSDENNLDIDIKDDTSMMSDESIN